MPVTLTDEQAAQLRQERAQWERDRYIAQGSIDIWNDPNMSDEAKALWKRKFPESPIDGYDQKQELLQILAKEREERASEKKAAADNDINERIATARRRLREDRGYTDDAIERLEKFMGEREIPNHEDAADLWAVRNPQPSDPSDSSGFRWNHAKTEGWDEIAKDPEGYAEREILRTLNDMNTRQRGGWR